MINNYIIILINYNSKQKFDANGYMLPIVMFNKSEERDELSPTSYPKEFMKTFVNILDECKKHLVIVKDSIGIHDLEMRDLKKFGNCMYVKKEMIMGKYTPLKIILPRCM